MANILKRINKLSTSKEKILESARDLFHLNGYKNTSIDDILKSSGVTKVISTTISSPKKS